MADFDAFNGDADGICALIQLRLDEPRQSALVTGVKRDIALLTSIDGTEGDRVTALDISMEKNIEPLQRLLQAGAEVLYVDHHFAGDIPEHPKLEALINTASEVCTSLLINGRLKGRYAAWAVTGAFGDNLANSARAAAKAADLDDKVLGALERLGTYINYNGYGPTLDDLHFEPAELYRKLVEFKHPLDFIEQDKSTFEKLENGYRDDMQKASSIAPSHREDAAAVFMFPDAAWSRRVSGVFSNELVNQHPDRSHAVVTQSQDGSLLISVRAPLNRREGADEICRQFPTGGGRKAAAGINALPADQLPAFIDVFSRFYRQN